MGQLGKGERGLQASGRVLGKLHRETSTESREQKNLMKKGEMRVRSHEGLKNEEILVQTGCCLSEEQLGKSQAWEFQDAGNEVATGILGSKNRGRARRSREGSPSAQLSVEHFWNIASRY